MATKKAKKAAAKKPDRAQSKTTTGSKTKTPAKKAAATNAVDVPNGGFRAPKKRAPAKKKAAKAAKPRPARIAVKADATIKLHKDTAKKSVEYEMSIGGKDVKGKFILGDKTLLKPCGDGKHSFMVKSNAEDSTINFAIGIAPEAGGFTAIKEDVASFR